LADRFGTVGGKQVRRRKGGTIVARNRSWNSRPFSAKITIIAIFTGIFFLVGSPAALAAPSDLLARFKAEAPRAWKQIESSDESPGTVRVTVKVTTFSAGKLASQEDKKAMLRRKTGFYFFEPLQSRGGGRIYWGKNPAYSYSVLKEDDKEGCKLGELQLAGGPNFGKIALDMYQYVKPNSYVFIPSLGLLSEAIANPRFKVLRAEEAKVGLVRVHFKTVVGITGKEVGLTGWMDLDPDNCWAPAVCEFEASVGTSFKVVKHFSSSQHGGYRPCESWESVSRSSEAPDFEHRQHTQFEVIDTSPPADEFFTLSHFGLPEPMGVKPPERPHSWLWLLAAAAGMAALAVLFAGLKRRAARRAAQAPPSPHRGAV
jgi:hypothetical protein